MLVNTERAIKMINSETLATQGTRDEEKQNKNTTQICVGHHYTIANKHKWRK